MRDFVTHILIMLFLLGVVNSKSVSQSNVKAQKKDELESNSNDNIPNLGSCGASRSCEPYSYTCSPQPDSTSSSIAIKAAQDARAAAAAQQLAGAQASHQVKAQLAEKAIQAAKAAEAALAGKLVLVNQLEHEVCEAEAVVVEEANSCRKTHFNLQVALGASGYASQLLKKLLSALRISQASLCYSQQVAQGTSEEMTEKLALLEAAKCRLNALTRELCVARQDLTAISEAACKAQAAAKAACSCAQRPARKTKREYKAYKKINTVLNKILGTGKVIRQALLMIPKR